MVSKVTNSIYRGQADSGKKKKKRKAITPWQIDGETMETVTDLFSWAPKSLQMVTAVMKLKDYGKPRQHIKKHRHYFVNKGSYIVKAMVFPVVMYRCERWTIKKAEH